MADRPEFEADFAGFDGAVPNDDVADKAVIRRLADMTTLDYERARKDEAKRLGCRETALDRLVEKERSNGLVDTKGLGRPLDLPSPKPWPHPVNGAALLRSLARHFSRHLILPTGAADAMALWTVHCHCFEVFAFTPRLQFKAPTKGAGKSTALALLKGVVPKPLETESISQAFLFRAIEVAQPTVLMDEADTYLRDDLDLRAMINAGVKRGAQAGRCVGEDQEPRMFSCHAPVALAGIGSLPGPIEDRAIKVLMRRRLRGETIRPIDDLTRAIADRLASKAGRWVQDHRDALGAARPDMGSLINRGADRWRTLYAVADRAGGEWPERARAAQAAINEADDDDSDSLGERLLADVHKVFDAWFREHVGDPLSVKRHEIPTAEIVERLIAMQDRPWPEMGRSHRQLTTTRFTQMVGKFGVPRRRLVVNGKPGPWGYRVTDFEDAFGRYLDA